MATVASLAKDVEALQAQVAELQEKVAALVAHLAEQPAVTAPDAPAAPVPSSSTWA